MDFRLSRYRNLTVLLIVIAAQLLLLAYQVKSNKDLHAVRSLSVGAIAPVAQLVEGLRAGTVGFFKDYFVLLNAREENRRLRDEVTKLKLENQFLKNELSTADRARALAVFTQRTPSRTIGARVIANATSANSKVVFVDRGSDEGVRPGMAVVTPDGIAGKVIAAYRNASQVMLITDATFAAGVISEKHRVHGALRGQGHGTLIVDYVPTELKVEVGERFYTSGDDRIFPKGLPVGEVKVVRAGRAYKEIFIAPYGLLGGLEELLIILEGVHQPLPAAETTQVSYHLQTLPPDAAQSKQAGAKVLMTDADRVRAQFRRGGAPVPGERGPAAQTARPETGGNTVQAAEAPEIPGQQ
ncbi:MAG: rod shape-determining protein MreC [Bryobacteraceae bacterium]|nr:rod shape-determining protein MreC [Bryobacteraceae bacterium]